MTTRLFIAEKPSLAQEIDGQLRRTWDKTRTRIKVGNSLATDLMAEGRSAALEPRARYPRLQVRTTVARFKDRKRVFAFALVLLASAIGFIAWNGKVYLLAFSALFPSLWSRAPSRLVAGLVAFCYYAMAARGLLPGTQVFFGSYGPYASTFLGFLFVAASAVILASPWWLLWTRDPSPTAAAWRLPAAFTLVSVPPIGSLGWANPITSAGVLFPGWRWYGLAAVVVIMCLTIILRRPSHLLALVLFCAVPSAFSERPPTPPHGWKGVDTYFGRASANEPFISFYEQNRLMITTAMNSNGSSVLVFPEAVAGHWNHTTAQLWQEASDSFTRALTVLLGAEHFANEAVGSERYDAVIGAVGSQSGILYRQRLPMPVSMWRPFFNHGARSHWLASGVFLLNSRKVAALMCYEQVLIWPVLISMAHQPEVIIAPANAWWSHNTSIPDIQHNALASWSRLFRIPVISAFNY